MKDSDREVSFYHLTSLPVHKAAPKLIEKIYYSKKKLLVICPNEEAVKMLDDGLWAYSTKHFIPHGTFKDDYKDIQPVYITHKQENPGQADIIMTIAKVDLDLLDFFPNPTSAGNLRVGSLLDSSCSTSLPEADLEKSLIESHKILHLFDGNDQTQLEFARSKWKNYKQQNSKLIYWQQKIDGSWENKA